MYEQNIFSHDIGEAKLIHNQGQIHENSRVGGNFNINSLFLKTNSIQVTNQ